MTLTRQQKQIIEAGTNIALDAPSPEDRAYMARPRHKEAFLAFRKPQKK